MTHYFLWGSKYKIKRTTVRTRPFSSYVLHFKGFSLECNIGLGQNETPLPHPICHNWSWTPFSPFLAKTTIYKCHEEHNQGFGAQIDNLGTIFHLTLHVWSYHLSLCLSNLNHFPKCNVLDKLHHIGVSILSSSLLFSYELLQ